MLTELHPNRRRGVAACRDTANQLDVIRRIVSDVVASMPSQARSEDSAPASPTATSDHHRARLFDPDELEARLVWAKGLAGDTREVVLSNLRRAKALGSLRRVAAPPDASAVAALARDFPHCHDITALLERRIALAHCCSTPTFRLPPILLAGNPGCGKTALAKRIAGMMSVPHVQVDMASLQTAFTLVGLDVGYATGGPGRVWEVLQHDCMSPLILLDELDKARSDGPSDDAAGFLYNLLEPLTARTFSDAAIGLAIDASRISWIATCNDPRAIHPAVLSRFTVVDISMPTIEQMRAVIDSIHRELLSKAEWGAWFEQPLRAEVITALSVLSPREVSHAIEETYARAATAGRRFVVRDDVPRVGSRREQRHPVGFIHDNEPARNPK